MRLLLLALVCAVSFVRGATRTYYIAADEIEWNYLPQGKDLMSGISYNETFVASATRKRDGVHVGPHGLSASTSHTPETYVTSSNVTIGRRYKKAVYREYTDRTFATLSTVAPAWQHLGLLGPVIRAEVGDTILVYFKNQASQPYSIHPHGLKYLRFHAGVPQIGSLGDDGNLVLPNSTWIYNWEVPERAGPGPSDLSSVLWMYHSHVSEVGDTNAGLIGPLIISRRGAGRSQTDLTPRDVSREYIVCFNIYDENQSPYLNASADAYVIPPPENDTMRLLLYGNATFIEGNLKHTVNGFLYSNVPGITMTAGERVRWYVFGLGSETDVHGVHWHGQTLLHFGRRVDVTEIIPASMKTLDMTPDSAGTWMLHCHTNHHIHAGMIALFQVSTCANPCRTAPPLLSNFAQIVNLLPILRLLLLAALLFSLLQ